MLGYGGASAEGNCVSRCPNCVSGSYGGINVVSAEIAVERRRVLSLMEEYPDGDDDRRTSVPSEDYCLIAYYLIARI